jgi:hypothetical protein
VPVLPGVIERKRKGPRDVSAALLSTRRAAGAGAPIETRYSGLLIMPQAMRGGAVLEAPPATA